MLRSIDHRGSTVVKSVDELKKVSGIGAKTIEKLKRICYSGLVAFNSKNLSRFLLLWLYYAIFFSKLLALLGFVFLLLCLFSNFHGRQ